MNFFSRGKLLLSGEYLVLKGATALAVPLLKGQHLKINKSGNTHELKWESNENGKTWFSATYALPFFDIVESSEHTIAENLARHFRAISKLNPGFQSLLSGVYVITDLEFEKQWGFGSSSTLISNLAQWADIDPFTLNKMVSSGSGYDVVCAQQDGPVFFRLIKKEYDLQELNLHPSVTNGLYFVYLGKKADTSKKIAKFLGQSRSFRTEINLISELSKHLGNANTLEDFGYYMKEHEHIMASVLKMEGLKEGIFKDLKGEAKSLGAWGGDFAMITWNDSAKELKKYLTKKGLNPFFEFNELVKTR